MRKNVWWDMMWLRFSTVLTFLIIGTYITYTDIRKQTIYNEAVGALFVPAIVSFFAFPEIDIGARVAGSMSVSICMVLINLLKPGSFGGGDIKLMVPIGLILGLEKTLWAVMAAVAITALGWCIKAGYKAHQDFWLGEQIPLGPGLCLGAGIMLLSIL